MNKIEALVEAANNDNSDDMEINADALAGYGDTILELCAMLEKAEEALEKYHACFNILTDGPDESDQALAMSWFEQGRELRKEYLAAIKQWRQT